MAAAAILNFQTSVNLTFYTLKRAKLRHRAKFYRNRSNHGRDMAFFDFSRWRPPPFGFSDFEKFNGRNAQEGQTASPCQYCAMNYNSLVHRAVIKRPRCGDFSIFQVGGRRHLGFSNFVGFNGRNVITVHGRYRDRETDGRTDRQTDRIIVPIPRYEL